MPFGRVSGSPAWYATSWRRATGKFSSAMYCWTSAWNWLATLRPPAIVYPPSSDGGAMARPSELSAFVEPLGALLLGVLLAAAARRYVTSARPRPRCLPPDLGVRVALLPGLRTLRPVQKHLAQDVF